MRATVSLDAVVANWRVFQRLAGSAECAAVVKADAYGLGAVHIAKALARAGARTFFTATLAEALAVRRALGAGPVVAALNGAGRGELGLAAEAGITLTLNSLAQAQAFAAQNVGPAPFLHIDTGMNRLGVRTEEAGAAAAALAACPPSLALSHLACASDRAHPMNGAQRDRFIAAAAAFAGARLSLAASAGAQLGPDFAFDMIRPGVGLYGWDGMDRPTTELKVAARVEAPVIQRRHIKAGETCGYGATFTAAQPIEAAIVACGYADGYLRAGAGKAAVGFEGRLLPVLGRVSMDLLIVNANAAPGLEEGAMVELLGETATVEHVAAAGGTLPYEVFTTFVGRAKTGYIGPA